MKLPMMVLKAELHSCTSGYIRRKCALSRIMTRCQGVCPASGPGFHEGVSDIHKVIKTIYIGYLNTTQSVLGPTVQGSHGFLHIRFTSDYFNNFLLIPIILHLNFWCPITLSSFKDNVVCSFKKVISATNQVLLHLV